MPIPSVDPIPLPPTLLRLAEPDDAQDASYLAASARMASFSRVSSRGMCSLYVPMRSESSAKALLYEAYQRRDEVLDVAP